jgi:hypothetical protein
MGWSFYDDCKTVEDVTATVTRDMAASGWAVLRQKRTRENGRTVLWSLVDTVEGEPGATRTVTRIVCDLLEREGRLWGNKTLSESSGPFFYSCPLAFLARAPEVNAEWRAKVRQFHAAKKTAPKLAAGDVFALAQTCTLQGESIGGLKVRVVTARPLVVEFIEATAQSPGLKGFRAKVSRRSLVPVQDVREVA